MMDSTIKKDILEEIEKLEFEGQKRVLSFARSLTRTRTAGTPGKELLDFAGTIGGSDKIVLSENTGLTGR